MSPRETFHASLKKKGAETLLLLGQFADPRNLRRILHKERSGALAPSAGLLDFQVRQKLRTEQSRAQFRASEDIWISGSRMRTNSLRLRYRNRIQGETPGGRGQTLQQQQRRRRHGVSKVYTKGNCQVRSFAIKTRLPHTRIAPNSATPFLRHIRSSHDDGNLISPPLLARPMPELREELIQSRGGTGLLLFSGKELRCPDIESGREEQRFQRHLTRLLDLKIRLQANPALQLRVAGTVLSEFA